MQEELEAAGFDTECLGGGRIFHDVEKRSIEVFGYSQVSCLLSLFVPPQTFFFQNPNIVDLSVRRLFLVEIIVVSLQFRGKKRLKLKMNKLLVKQDAASLGLDFAHQSPLVFFTSFVTG